MLPDDPESAGNRRKALSCRVRRIRGHRHSVSGLQRYRGEPGHHLEHDIMLLQRQLATGHPSTGGDANIPAGGSAQLEVRLSAIEDQLRELRGKIEENDNRTHKLSENFDKLQHDVDFRFSELSGSASAAHPAAPVAIPQSTSAPTTASASGTASGTSLPPAPPAATDTSNVKPLLEKSAPFAAATPPAKAPENDTKPANTNDAKPVATQDLASFSTPRELYNYAFRLLNQTQYEEAATAFDAFTKKYPKDPLVGNSFYWEGETYYIRRDYVNAADNFRQGFEALPEGPKAADNLLKLAMSLNALSRDKEACLVLQQIATKFKKTSSSIVDKAEGEQKRIGCRKS